MVERKGRREAKDETFGPGTTNHRQTDTLLRRQGTRLHSNPERRPFTTSLDLALAAVTIDGWSGDWFCGGFGRLDDNLDDDEGPFERDTDADDLSGYTLVTSLVFGRHMPLDPLVIL